MFRQMAPSERLEMAMEMSDMVFEISQEGIRSRHADYTDHEVLMAAFASGSATTPCSRPPTRTWNCSIRERQPGLGRGHRDARLGRHTPHARRVVRQLPSRVGAFNR